jgi:hypothetical protein
MPPKQELTWFNEKPQALIAAIDRLEAKETAE